MAKDVVGHGHILRLECRICRIAAGGYRLSGGCAPPAGGLAIEVLIRLTSV